ncbi:MAG TPA: L-rhamnose isomerase [Planctomicrobium sp.]|nr:L-rhamnose isomerase [Planctomicrobium sp.]
MIHTSTLNSFNNNVAVALPVSRIEQAFEIAREVYSELGVDVNAALRRMATVSLSLHCWQGDDVAGFEGRNQEIGGGLAVTGRYPGRARTADDLRSDLDLAQSLIPGTHRVNLHAIYGEFGERKVDRNEIEPIHFQGWIDWARERGLSLDFNPTYFAHENAAEGFTLTHLDPGIRRFWIEHGIACRKIGAEMGRQLGTPCVTNVWIPDGMKDLPIDRKGPRERLANSLDEIFREELNPAFHLDAVECKLFGIGTESYVAGSHEFYLGYALTRKKLLCLDMGHFHPTEVISDKLSAVLTYLPEILLHVSRGVRWDSDHVVLLTDQILAIAQELVRGDFLSRTHLGLDFFDASINRVGAWVIGTRCLLKAVLMALLEPIDMLREFEESGDYTARLAMLEELKTLPFGAVWDYYCLLKDVPPGHAWMKEIRRYETSVLSFRN